jgi:hypothetical protein
MHKWRFFICDFYIGTKDLFQKFSLTGQKVRPETAGNQPLLRKKINSILVDFS